MALNDPFVLRLAEPHWYLLHNPAEGLALPRPEQSLPQVLNEAEIARLIETPNLQTAIGLRDRALLEILYATGIRHAEAQKSSTCTTWIPRRIVSQCVWAKASAIALCR